MLVLADLQNFVSNHRRHGPWPPTPRSLRGMATVSRWRVRVGWCLSGGWRRRRRTPTWFLGPMAKPAET